MLPLFWRGATPLGVHHPQVRLLTRMTLGLKKRYFDFPGSTMEKNPSADAGDTGDASLIPGSGRSPGGGYGNPLQYSFLGNLMSRGALWVTAHGVAELDMTEPVSTTYYYSFIIEKGHKSEPARKFLRDISPSTPQHIYTSCCQCVTIPMANQETSSAPQTADFC